MDWSSDMKSTFGKTLLLQVATAILALVCFHSQTNAQPRLLTASASDSLSVSISNISIDGQFSVRGLSADFPHPVISTISITDREGNAIIGLADTSRWIGPNDLTQLGLPVSEIWRPVLEYHQEDPAIPNNPDVYDQIPEPLFLEVRTGQQPTTTMLVMDASGSMREEIEDAKQGARLFVEQLQPADRAGVIVFASTIKNFRAVTGDKDSLIATINAAEALRETALYDALMRAVRELRFEGGRRGIVVYTDGRDNRSTETPQTVIDSASVYNIPIFTIALGEETNESNLKRVAKETGGFFFKVATAEEMQAIYLKLSQLIQNFYFMAHSSPDPVRNGTWRVVDLSLNAFNFHGRGTGQYFVPAPPPPPPTDLGISITSITDTSAVRNGDTLNAVEPGDFYQYAIRLQNLGPNVTDTLRISHFLPGFVSFVDATVPAFFTNDDLLAWQFENFLAGSDTTITVSVHLAEDVPDDVLTVQSVVRVTAENDTLPDNNFATDTTAVLFPLPPRILSFDLGLTQIVSTDTSVVFNGSVVPAVVAGDTFSYALRVENFGPDLAPKFTLFNTVPDSVTIFDLSSTPTTRIANTYFWQFDTLLAGQSRTITFNAKASPFIQAFPFVLESTGVIFAERDTNAVNDTSSTTTLALRPPDLRNYDLVLSQEVAADTTVVIAGQLVPAVTRGKTFGYTLLLENQGPGHARNFTLRDLLPDSVRVSNFSLAPTLADESLVTWEIDSLLAGEALTITFDAQIADSVQILPFQIRNESYVTAARDTNSANDSTLTLIYGIAEAGANLPGITDLAVTQRAITDSFAVVAGDTVRFARRAETYSYHIAVANQGSRAAQNVTVQTIFPDSVTVASIVPAATATRGDSIFWNLGIVLARSSLNFSFEATVAAAMPLGRNLLVNRVMGSASNEPDTLLANNASVDTVFNIERPAQDLPPLIEATPPIVDIGDTVSVRVQVRVPNVSWDLWVLLANGQIDSTYADDFISATQLEPNQWVNVRPPFADTRLLTQAEQEPIIFELRTVDIFGDFRTARARVTSQSNNGLVLERNVFAASKEDILRINFKLSSNRTARLDLFDITGSHVVKLADGPFNAGWNTLAWDGKTESGLRVGSGLYVVTLRSGGFSALKKVMVVR